ncbi:MAG: glycosyltransferase [Cyanothece sp. SIO2G6]|nr:glycosyltransferase [Cyanothece sp. SIO2G6]
MISSYVGLTPPDADWLWFQSPHPFGRWGNIQMMARSPQPDFLLFYNFHHFPNPPQPQRWPWKQQRANKQYAQALADFPAKMRGVPKERRIYLLREPPLDEMVQRHQKFYQQAQEFCGYVSGPGDDAPIPNYMPAIWYVGTSFRDLNEMPPQPKTKSCSWITSGISRTENHRKRLKFLQQLQESGLAVDFYGRDLPDWCNDGGQLGNKLHATAPYYYNLAIENYADNDWYVSEKLWDSLLSWCLPIYYGGPAADKLLPPGSFLRLPSMDEKGVKFIQDVTATPDAWHEAKAAIAEARQIILHKLNLINWLSDYVADFT